MKLLNASFERFLFWSYRVSIIDDQVDLGCDDKKAVGQLCMSLLLLLQFDGGIELVRLL